MDSILTSVKKILGIEEDYEQFDADLIIHINSVFMILEQLGVGKKEPFVIADKTATWRDFLGDDAELIAAVPSYVAMKVRLMFDPPSSQALLASMERIVSELEQRVMYIGDREETDATAGNVKESSLQSRNDTL
nr:MAG TPA: hypothetical protein [Caudoviricetes sp.]